MSRGRLRVGTRGSGLALWQAEWVRSRLDGPSEIVVIRTSGDRLKDVPLQGQSTTGFFTREIETALRDDRVDLAVHSLKDLPVVQPEGLVLAAILERHAPGDVLLVGRDAIDETSPIPIRHGARVGAGSLRRQSALASLRPDLEAVLVRGNVDTRVRKAREGQVDAIVLARAGLERLGVDPDPLVAYDLDPVSWIPAPGQAAVAVEVRDGDTTAGNAVAHLDDTATRLCVELERRLLVHAGGGCHAPFAAWARPAGDDGDVRVDVGAPGSDGSWCRRAFAGSLDEVEREASRWFASGCPATGAEPGEEEICRPARPWC